MEMKINYEAWFPINPFLKNIIKKQWLKKDIKNDSSTQLKLTRQTYDSSHEIRITI
jgi:hypothetical protein